jgi:uncharacterized protein YhfF
MEKIANWTELVPTYGRDYKNSAEVREAFLQGRDFKVAATGQATSLADEVFDVGTQVMLRYKRNQAVCIVKVTQKHLDEVNEKKATWFL